MNEPLCMDCIHNTSAMTAVNWSGPEKCVVCGNSKPRKPAGPTHVNEAFRIYFERLEMALRRAGVTR